MSCVDPMRRVPELPYVPAFYRDELLYSWMARYHRHTGGVSYSETAYDLLGRDVVKASLAAPVGLEALAARISPNGEIDGEWLVRNTTLYNYYSSFSDPEVASRGLSAQLGLEKPAAVILGIAAYWIKQPKALRFCRDCLPEMLAEHGEMWWRRAHQLPCVIVCPDHGTALQESDVHFAKNGMNALLGASPKTCLPTCRALVENVTPDQLAFAYEMSRRSRDLLENPRPHEQLEDIRMRYVGPLFCAGLMKSDRHVDLQPMIAVAEAAFGPSIGLLTDRLDTPAGIERWAGDILRKIRRSRHPFLHLLMEWLIETIGAVDHFGSGPWPCRNPVGGHHGKLTIQTVERRRRREGVVAGIFTCDCGYSYGINASPDGTVSRPKYRCYGPSLDTEILKMHAANSSQAEMSRRLQLHPKAISAAAHRLGLAVDWVKPEGTRLGSAEVMVKPKRKRIRPLESNPKPRRVPGPRIDWHALDVEILRRLDGISEDIRASRPFRRVTNLMIERELGQPGYISRRQGKLPLSEQRVLELSESREDFCWRRINIVVDEMRAENVALLPWVVRRRAGVRDQAVPAIRDYIDNLALIGH